MKSAKNKISTGNARPFCYYEIKKFSFQNLAEEIISAQSSTFSTFSQIRILIQSKIFKETTMFVNNTNHIS